MHVLMMPHDPENPYQRTLGEGLEGCGLTVTHSKWLWKLPLSAGKRPDVVHIHWLRGATTTRPKYLIGVPFLVCQLLRFKLLGGAVVWTVHNLKHHEGLFQRRERLLGTIVAKLANAVMVHSASAVEPVMERFGVKRERLHVVPHPAYILQHSGISRAEARKRLGLSGAGVLFVFAGTVRPYKGVEELLAAHKKADNASAHLVIAGRPRRGYGPEIEEIAKDVPNVTLWLRRLDDEEIELLLIAANAVVLPYRSILTSGALVLAMGLGRACIAPNMGVFEEHLAGGGGVLYEPGDVDLLAAALEESAADPGKLDEFGTRNRNLAATWNARAVGAQTAEVYRKARAAR